MKRREFLQGGGHRAWPATAIAAPAIAQSMPELKWRLTSSFPEVARHHLRRGGRCSPRRWPRRPTTSSRSRSSPPARSCPACRLLDAVQNGTVEMGHTASYYYFGKDPTFAFGTAVPFGLNAACRTPG